MKVRAARAGDLQRVAEIHVAGWRNAYATLIDASILAGLSVETCLEAWKQRCAEPGAELWIAESVEGEILGFSRLLPASDDDLPEGFAEISHVYLDPAHYERGLGAVLLRHVLASAQGRGFEAVVLWVLEGNARARHFYEREGFAVDGARKADPARRGPGVYEVRYRRALEEAG